MRMKSPACWAALCTSSSSTRPPDGCSKLVSGAQAFGDVLARHVHLELPGVEVVFDRRILDKGEHIDGNGAG